MAVWVGIETFLSMGACTCCGRPTPPARVGYRVRLPLCEIVTLPDGARAALRYGWSEYVLCAACVQAIERAAARRMAARRGRLATENYEFSVAIWG